MTLIKLHEELLRQTDIPVAIEAHEKAELFNEIKEVLAKAEAFDRFSVAAGEKSDEADRN